MNVQRFSELIEKAQKLRKLNELYNKVINLHDLGARSYKISKILEVEDGIRIHPDTIRKWYQGPSHPLGKYNTCREGPELAYVTSAWLGDGTLNENKLTATYDIILRTIDLDFATEWGSPWEPRSTGSRINLSGIKITIVGSLLAEAYC